MLAGARLNPAIELVRDALGRERTTVRWLDRFERGRTWSGGHERPRRASRGALCDVLMMTRASYMIADPPVFLRDTRRMLRPGGLMMIDWLHGAADAPRLDLPGHHEYDGRAYPFLTTYADAESLVERAEAFEAFIRHVNRPPSWVDLERPGQVGAPSAAGVRRVLGKRPVGSLTRAPISRRCEPRSDGRASISWSPRPWRSISR